MAVSINKKNSKIIIVLWYVYKKFNRNCNSLFYFLEVTLKRKDFIFILRVVLNLN